MRSPHIQVTAQDYDGMMGDCIAPYFNRILGSYFLQMLDENEINRQEI
jgi:hypothetical protein